MINQEIINQSIEYILQHLDEDLTVKEVAGQFHFSEFYFNREFRAFTGESIYSFIKRQRVNQSAMEMKINQEKSITDIGQKYGYSASNYSSLFKKLKRVSPAEFRKTANLTSRSNPFISDRIENFETYDLYNQFINVVHKEDTRVLYERFIGNYGELKDAWYDFIDRHCNDMQENTLLMERFFDDPKVSEVNQCICDLCMSVESNYDKENVITLKGGRFVVYAYSGKIVDIYRTLQGIFSIWLPKSGYQMDQRYGYNIYHDIDREKDSVIMDLCIPIK